MNASQYSLPAPIGKLLSRLPGFPGSMLFSAGLNMVLSTRLPQDAREALCGKRLCIMVTDARLRFDFVWNGRRFIASHDDGRAPDLMIAACMHDFLLLARRQEDPDTLFFSRRLLMEGDTELGLLVKNTLDAFELPVFDLGRRSLTRRSRNG